MQSGGNQAVDGLGRLNAHAVVGHGRCAEQYADQQAVRLVEDASCHRLQPAETAKAEDLREGALMIDGTSDIRPMTACTARICRMVAAATIQSVAAMIATIPYPRDTRTQAVITMAARESTLICTAGP